LWNPLNVSSESVEQTGQIAETLSNTVSDPEQAVKNVANKVVSSANGTSIGLGDLINSVKGIATNMTSGLFKVLSTIFGGLLSLVLIVVLSFYFVVQEDGVSKFLALVTPVKHEKYVIDLWKRSQRKIGQWMQGQLLLAILVGILVYLGLMILGIENALLFAVIAACLEIIPVFGPIIAAIPAIIAAFLNGGVTMSLLVAGLYVIVQQFESHLIYPLVVKKIVGIPPIMVILALLVGQKIAGFLGIVLSVPFTAALMEYFDDVEKQKNLFWQKTKETEK